MASISKTQDGIKVRWDSKDWEKGLLPWYNISRIDDMIGEGWIDSTALTPYRFPWYIAPGFQAVSATNVSTVDNMIKNAVVSSNLGYAISGGADLYLLSNITTPVVSTDVKVISAHGGHSTVVGQDVIVYYANVGSTLTKLLFYSWNDSNDGDVGKYNFGTWTTAGNFDDDFMTTVPTGFPGTGFNNTNPKPMIVGDDNILYIGNGAYLASYQGNNGADGTVNYQALDLPTGYVITSFAKTQDFLVIYAYRGVQEDTTNLSECTAFFWDMVSPSYIYAFPLQGNYVNGGFNYQSTPGCFVQGQSADVSSGKQSKMLLFTGSNFETMVQFNDSIPTHGGVQTTGESILWNSDGKIFQWGSVYVGLEKALNKIAVTSGTSSGMLRNLQGTVLLASAGTGSNGGLQKFASNNYSESSIGYTGMCQLPSLSRTSWKVDHVQVAFRKTVTEGRGFRLAIVSDNNQGISNTRGSTTDIINSNGSPSVINQILKTYDESTTASQYLPFASTSIGLIFEWGGETPLTAGDAPAVEYVELYLIEAAQQQQD